MRTTWHAHFSLRLLPAVIACGSLLSSQCEFAELAPDAPVNLGWFGFSCALGGDRLAVGEIAVTTSDDESVSVYRLDGVNWFLDERIVGPGAFSCEFGADVALDESGTTLVIGASGDNTAGTDAGAAYVFTRVGVDWTQDALLIGSSSQGGDFFGSAVAIDGDRLVVGARRDGGGSAFVFERINGVWQETAQLFGSDTALSDSFGDQVAIREELIAVGATNYEAIGVWNSGGVYAFEQIGGVWIETGILVGSDVTGGESLSTCAIGDDVIFTGGRSGTAYAFEFDPVLGWVETQIIGVSNAAGIVASSLSTDDTTLAVSAVSDGGGAGAAFVFQKVGSLWTEIAKLVPSGAEADNGSNGGSNFSQGLAVRGDILAGGGFGTDVFPVDDGGKIWTFSLSDILCPTLAGSEDTLPLFSGGTEALQIDAGPEQAGALYWLVGSLSGTNPGFPLGSFQVPINPDDYFALTLVPNPASPLTNNRGLLDENGQAQVVLRVPPNSDPSLVGLELSHAFASFTLSPFVVASVSNVDTTRFEQ